MNKISVYSVLTALSHKLFCIFSVTSLLITLNNPLLTAQQRIQLPEGGYEIHGNSGNIVLPFRIVDNLIVLEMTLNGISLDLIFDSGMPLDGAILFGSPRVDSTQLAFQGKMPIGGVDGKVILSDFSSGSELKHDSLTLTNQTILVLPHNEKRSLHFWGIDGIIGFSFFNSFIVTIDYSNKTLVLNATDNISCCSEGEEIPIEVTGNRIFVNAEVTLGNQELVSGLLVVDTGNRTSLVLNTGFSEDLTIPAKYVPFLNHGLSDAIAVKAGRIEKISLGSYVLPDALALFTDSSSGTTPPWEKLGNLGNDILRRFTVTINVHQNIMYLKKNDSFTDPFELNMAGIQYSRTNDGYLIITNIFPGSPAEEKKLMINDIIISVNNSTVTHKTKDEIESLLKNGGQTISLEVERQNRRFRSNLRLKRII